VKWPKLVHIAKTDIHVTIDAEDINEFGERETLLDDDFLCNYQSSAEVKYTSDKEAVTLSAVALIDGDICPSIPEITSGKVRVFGASRTIYRGSKCRNPDGTVNYTRLELI